MKKVFLSLFFISIISYSLMVIYYRTVFSVNTWINGQYAAGKTVEEMNQELLEKTKAPVLLIRDINENEFVLDLEEFISDINFMDSLTNTKSIESSLFWISSLFHKNEIIIKPTIIVNNNKVEEWLKESVFADEIDKKREVSIVKAEKGYTLYDGLSSRLNQENAKEYIFESITNGNYELILDTNFYSNLTPTKEDENLLDLWNKIEEFITCNIGYDMGDQILYLTKDITSEFVFIDDNQQLSFNEEGVKEFIYSLAREYNTYGKEREFYSSRGDMVLVPSGGTYGTEIDVEAEIEYLKTAFLEKKEEIHIPTYKHEAYVRGKNDIGDTYIEIDMTEQKMYYYEKGEQVIVTDIVTGNLRGNMATKGGVNFVYNKQKNRVLRGADYAAPVKFWVPVKGNIGIHDASWRSKFGGEIYKTSGSHGCINTPTDIMTQLYDMIEIGLPVIMFY